MKSKNIWPWLIIGAIFLSIQSFGNPFFVFQEFNYLAQPFDVRGIAKGVIYLIGYLLSVGAICALILSKNNSLFKLGVLWVGLTQFFDLFLQSLGTYRGLSLEELKLAASQYQLFLNMQTYAKELVISLVGSLAIIGLFVFIRKKVKKRVSNLVSVGVLLLAFATTFSSVKRVYSILYNSYPAPIKSISILMDYSSTQKTVQNHLLKETITSIDSLQSNKNIVWIIDESVTGSYLSINGYPQPTTPYLDSAIIENNNLHNLGIVNAISNCSNTSNYYLRVGLTPQMDFSLLENLPSILSYAKNAGYEVIMMDSQITKGEMANYLTSDEVSLLDEFHTLERNIIPSERDAAMNKLLFEQLKKGGKKKFILYIKFGCHWPYLLNFDKENPIFKPIQPSTATPMTLNNKNLITNTYLNSIYYNVDMFWKELVTNINPVQNIVFYTSDHGQSLLESNRVRTHCSSNMTSIPKSEFDVPLMLYTSDFEIQKEEQSYSQIQLFPTTLHFMGYETTRMYGESLIEGQIINRKSFITGTGNLYDFD